MIDMKLYEDINRLYPIESMSLDSNSTQDPLSPPSRSKGNWFKKIFKFKRQVCYSCDGVGVGEVGKGSSRYLVTVVIAFVV